MISTIFGWLLVWLNGGYFTFPNNLLIQWGKVKGGNSGGAAWVSVDFLKKFTSYPIVATGVEWTATTTEAGHGYIKSESITKEGMSVSTPRNYVYTYWIAIGY